MPHPQANVLHVSPSQHELLERLVEIGRAEGLNRITADILAENRPMQDISRRLGFKLKRSMGDSALKAVLELSADKN